MCASSTKKKKKQHTVRSHVHTGRVSGPRDYTSRGGGGVRLPLLPPRPANCLLPGLITSLCYSVNARRKPLAAAAAAAAAQLLVSLNSSRALLYACVSVL